MHTCTSVQYREELKPGYVETSLGLTPVKELTCQGAQQLLSGL
jgi:hypothetical protein